MKKAVTIQAWASINDGPVTVGNIAFFPTKREAESAWGNQTQVVSCEITLNLSS